MLKVGIAGIGHLGKHHLRLLGEIPGVEISGCYDTESAVQKTLQDEGYEVFETFEGLVSASHSVDIVVPTDMHYPLASQALQSGCHVFLEKPITESVEHARELVALAEQNDLILQVGHIERFNPALSSLRGVTLNPRFIESHRLAQFNPRGTEVAVILDLMIHDIDVILALVDSPVERVEASGVPVITDSADIANARVTFENGCVANITASRISQNTMRKLRIFQPSAYISIDFHQGNTEIYRLRDESEESTAEMPVVMGKMEYKGASKYIVYEQPKAEERNALLEELKAFVHSIETGEPPLVSGKDGVKALEVAQLIQQKVKESSVLNV